MANASSGGTIANNNLLLRIVPHLGERKKRKRSGRSLPECEPTDASTIHSINQRQTHGRNNLRGTMRSANNLIKVLPLANAMAVSLE